MDAPELAFDTIGNATLILYDRAPILATDPWFTGSAYFGSWGLSHEVPDEQRQAIQQARYIWVSHGHPDHLNWDSLPLLRDRHFLIPDHYGRRILDGLRAQGYKASLIEDRRWVPLTDCIKVMSLSDVLQDAILLVDIGGRLVINLNDANDSGWGRFVARIAASYEISFLLMLSGFGDADMINFFDEAGQRILPEAAARRPIGAHIQNMLEKYNARYSIPFSSMHRYVRVDSAWANDYVAHLADHAVGFEGAPERILPAFIRYDCTRDTWKELRPREHGVESLDPARFGDDWSELLEAKEKAQLTRYFRSFEHLARYLDFVTLRVGGQDHVVELAPRKYHRGITFEAPRSSLMTAVDQEIFDDLLIGNFMKTTLHGSWEKGGLASDFTPYVAKYGDNGRARTREELEVYLRDYRRRANLEWLLHHGLEYGRACARHWLPRDRVFFPAARRVFRALRHRV
jgi:hypothetical protein